MIPIYESDFQAGVIEVAQLRDWRYYHTHDSRRSPEGFPDLVFVRPPRLIFAELKVPGGIVKSDQYFWLSDLAEVERLETRLWLPSDWDDIERTLK